MPTEAARVVSYRRIRPQTKQEDGSWKTDKGTNFYLGVIDEISFIDKQTPEWQETRFKFNNKKPNTTRVSKIVPVYSGDPPNPSSGSRILVERAVNVDVLDKQTADWSEWIWWYLKSDTKNSPVHYTTHTYKIYNRNSDGSKGGRYIKVQRIDEIRFLDKQQNGGQDFYVRLNWKDWDNENTHSWPFSIYTKDDETTINPPWRIDPFQTIVGFHGGLAVVFYDGTS